MSTERPGSPARREYPNNMNTPQHTQQDTAAPGSVQPAGSVWVVSFRNDRYRNDAVHAVFAAESDALACVDNLNMEPDGAVFYARCWPVIPNNALAKPHENLPQA